MSSFPMQKNPRRKNSPKTNLWINMKELSFGKMKALSLCVVLHVAVLRLQPHNSLCFPIQLEVCTSGEDKCSQHM